jgi:Raf kinase inhibitor-like YbhB/YbcL family protein
MQLTSPAFAPGGQLPRSATCEGAGISPPLAVANTPEATRSLAIIVDDPDAPHGSFSHWVAWNLSASTRALPANAGASNRAPSEFVQGTNGFNRIGYGGACPPRGVHRYVFRAFALDTPLPLREGAHRDDLVRAMRGHVLAEATLVGTSTRGRMH